MLVEEQHSQRHLKTFSQRAEVMNAGSLTLLVDKWVFQRLLVEEQDVWTLLVEEWDFQGLLVKELEFWGLL